MNKAIFLDRDGTINEEMGYINHLSRFKVFDFVYEAIRILNNEGYKIIVITNQSGLARGYFDKSLLERIHSNLLTDAQKNKARIDKIYYCPHHKNGIIAEYSKECDCRKPKPGLLLKARDEFNIDMSQSYIIGDRYKDMQFGLKNGLKTIMVMTGYGLGEYTYQKNNWPQMPDFICQDLLEAAEIISKWKHT